MNYWGYHLRIDASACDKRAISDVDYVRNWVTDLVIEIGMIAYGAPWIKHFGHEPHIAGITVFQPIETSNICGHFSDATGDAYIDVFSCKSFKTVNAIIQFKKWFRPKDVRWDYTVRQANRGNV